MGLFSFNPKKNGGIFSKIFKQKQFSEDLKTHIFATQELQQKKSDIIIKVTFQGGARSFLKYSDQVNKILLNQTKIIDLLSQFFDLNKGKLKDGITQEEINFLETKIKDFYLKDLNTILEHMDTLEEVLRKSDDLLNEYKDVKTLEKLRDDTYYTQF